MCVPSRLECKEEHGSVVFFSKNFDLRFTGNKTYFAPFYRTPMKALTKLKKALCKRFHVNLRALEM